MVTFSNFYPRLIKIVYGVAGVVSGHVDITSTEVGDLHKNKKTVKKVAVSRNEQGVWFIEENGTIMTESHNSAINKLAAYCLMHNVITTSIGENDKNLTIR